MQSLTPQSSRDSALELFIFNRDGDMILAPTGEGPLVSATSQQRLPDGLVTATGAAPSARTVVLPWRDGKHHLTASARLRALDAVSELGWTIVAREPIELAFAEANRTVRTALAVGQHEADIPQVTSNREVRQLSQAMARLGGRKICAVAARHRLGRRAGHGRGLGGHQGPAGRARGGPRHHQCWCGLHARCSRRHCQHAAPAPTPRFTRPSARAATRCVET